VAVTRERIVQAAIKLLKRDGLDALSLRKLATELNVAAPTLYWHVASKRELLDLVAEELVRGRQAAQREQPAPGQPWWEWLYEWAEGAFDALVATPDAPRVVAGNRPSVESLPRLERTLSTLVAAGLPAADAQQALFALGAYTIGAATEWQGEMARAVDGAETDARLAAAIRSGEFPRLSEAMSGIVRQPPRATFEYGLRLLVDALRARYAPESLAGD
jgi:AcrR family transcriptional regulator